MTLVGQNVLFPLFSTVDPSTSTSVKATITSQLLTKIADTKAKMHVTLV